MEASTVLTAVCGGSTLIAIAALVWFSRPRPSAPSQTIIIQPPAAQSEDSLAPTLIMVFVVFLMFGGGLFIYLAR